VDITYRRPVLGKKQQDVERDVKAAAVRVQAFFVRESARLFKPGQSGDGWEAGVCTAFAACTDEHKSARKTKHTAEDDAESRWSFNRSALAMYNACNEGDVRTDQRHAMTSIHTWLAGLCETGVCRACVEEPELKKAEVKKTTKKSEPKKTTKKSEPKNKAKNKAKKRAKRGGSSTSSSSYSS
jgi:hypothetical protein